MGEANVVGTTDHKGMAVPDNWLQDLKILIYSRVVGFPDDPAIAGGKLLQDSCPKTKQGGWKPL